MKSIVWKGKTIAVGEGFSTNAYMVFMPSNVKWNGTEEGLASVLVTYLDQLPPQTQLGWSKETIDGLRLSGDLALDNKEKVLSILTVRSYGHTEKEKTSMGPRGKGPPSDPVPLDTVYSCTII